MLVEQACSRLGRESRKALTEIWRTRIGQDRDRQRPSNNRASVTSLGHAEKSPDRAEGHLDLAKDCLDRVKERVNIFYVRYHLSGFCR